MEQSQVLDAKVNRMRTWFFINALLILFGMALAAIPNRFEGPSLLTISPGHGITVADMVALVPLALGMSFMMQTAWPVRRQFRAVVRIWVNRAGVEMFLLGLGIGVFATKILTEFRHGPTFIWGSVTIMLIVAFAVAGIQLGFLWWRAQTR